LLAETGRKVKRFQEPFPVGGRFDAAKFSTFVIIGRTRREINADEITHILDWVSAGGTLVVIDREPPKDLISTTANWSITQEFSKNIVIDLNTDPSNQKKMIGETEAVKPILPTILINNINAVQPSQFVSSIKISRLYNTESEDEELDEENNSQPPPPIAKEESEQNAGIGSGNTNTGNEELFATPIPTPIKPVFVPTPPAKVDEYSQMSLVAPVIHLANKKTNLLVDFPFGAGQIIYLSDPYIVSNGGINLVDNARLGVNMVNSKGGIIAFDEYHQGFGNTENRLLEYFSGTPVVAIFLQIFLIIGLIFYSQSRRFARALPADEPNRLSKLEYVSAMAQLQQQTKAYDLAIENIYGDFRRRVSRLVGVDNKTTSHKDLAKKIADRTKYDANELEDLLFKCKDIMHGEPTKKKEIVNLISQLREIENELGLRRGKKRKT
ncbi:MAG: DUF4350 domain-containing protein, partial [Aridibacter sp.]